MAAVSSDAIRAAIKVEDLAYALPVGPDTAGDHSYAEPEAETFQVRGVSYLEDRVKAPSAPSAFDLMQVDIFRSNDKIGNVAARKDSWLRAARAAGDTRFYLVVVYVNPSAPYLHLIFYYAVNSARLAELPHLEKLWKQFTSHGPEGDAFRNERWKVIPRVAEGPWAVQYAVGTKPALLATKLTHTWIMCDTPVGTTTSGAAAGSPGSPAGGYRHRANSSYIANAGPGPYLESDCDVSSSSMALMLLALLQGSARYLVIDLGFAIEPREEDTLPEAVLGTARLSRLDVGRPPLISADPTDWVLGQPGVCHGGGAAGGASGGGK